MRCRSGSSAAERKSQLLRGWHAEHTTDRTRSQSGFGACQEVITTSKTIKDVAMAYGAGPKAPRSGRLLPIHEHPLPPVTYWECRQLRLLPSSCGDGVVIEGFVGVVGG